MYTLTIFMKKIIYTFIFAFAFVSFGYGNFADAAFNNASNDCTVPIAVENHTQSPKTGTGCNIKTSTSVSNGDTLNIFFYYHNNGTAAENAILKLTPDPRGTKYSNSVVFTGSIIPSSSPAISGSVTVTLPANTELKYQQMRLVDQGAKFGKTDQVDIGGTYTTDSSVFTSGYNLGSVIPGWTSQGTARLTFTVVSTGNNIDPNPTGTKPTAYTSTPTVNSSQGYATLKGSFTSGNLATTTCFQYRIVGTSSYTEVSCMNNGIADGDRIYQISNLMKGNYEYRIIATNSAGSANGAWVAFSINGGVIVIDNNYYPTVATTGATNVSNASNGNSNGYAVLNGNYNANGDTNFQTCFEITGTRNGTVYGPKTLPCVYRGNSIGNASASLGDLPAGYYEYRIIGLPTTGSKIDGYYQYFTINENNTYVPPVIIYPQPPIYYPPTTGYGAPTVTTLPVFNFNNTEANLDGYVNGNGCATSTWFEYGNYAYSLSNRTTEISRGSGAGNAMQYISGLSPSTMYYYRLAARNCTGSTIYGQVQSFSTANTTTRRIVQTSTVITRQSNNTTIVNGTGGNTKMVRLSIDNARTTMTRGEQVMYTVIWENVSNVVLNNLVLEVTMPKELKIMTTSRGDIDHSTNAVYLNIVRLDPQEEGQMFITANLNGNLQAGDPIVARAIMAFENSLLNNATDSAVEYDADNYIIGNTTGLAASIFGIGFLPSNLIGWLIIFLIIFLIVIAARHYVRTGRDDRDGTTTSSTSYTTYRPTQ